LIKDPKLRLLGKKVLLKTDIPLEVVLIDAAETSMERPKKKGSGIRNELGIGTTGNAIIIRERRNDTH
jgi:hypothetical protein